VKFTIVRSQTVKSPKLDRVGQDSTWVIYTTEDGRSGSVTIEAPHPTDEEIVAAVDAEEAKHGSLKGRTLGG